MRLDQSGKETNTLLGFIVKDPPVPLANAELVLNFGSFFDRNNLLEPMPTTCIAGQTHGLWLPWRLGECAGHEHGGLRLGPAEGDGDLSSPHDGWRLVGLYRRCAMKSRGREQTGAFAGTRCFCQAAGKRDWIKGTSLWRQCHAKSV